MRKTLCRAATAALVVVFSVAGTENRAQPARDARRNKVVEAVEKTKKGIVAIKVNKDGEWGAREVVGSGVIVDERGYVVTNHHVIASAKGITVRLADGKRMRAQVYADDPAHDLAILRLPSGHKLQALLAP